MGLTQGEVSVQDHGNTRMSHLSLAIDTARGQTCIDGLGDLQSTNVDKAVSNMSWQLQSKDGYASL